MTDEVLGELRALKARLAELEQMAAEAAEGGHRPMYGDNDTSDKSVAKDRLERQERMKAESWRYDASLEEALRLKADHPGEYRQLAPGTKMSVGYYLGGKAAAQKLGMDTTSGGQR